VGLHLARWGQKGPPASINRAWRASERALFNETRLQRGRIRAGHAIKKSIGNLSRCRTDDLEAQSLGHPGRNFGPETSDLSRHCDHGHGPLQSLNSIKESHFLVARHVAALVNVRVVTVNRQRNHGGDSGEQEDEGQYCDKGLHGWSPLGLPRLLSVNVTLGGLAEIEREAITVIEILRPISIPSVPHLE
jgi:hypothetical protein